MALEASPQNNFSSEKAGNSILPELEIEAGRVRPVKREQQRPALEVVTLSHSMSLEERQAFVTEMWDNLDYWVSWWVQQYSKENPEYAGVTHQLILGNTNEDIVTEIKFQKDNQDIGILNVHIDGLQEFLTSKEADTRVPSSITYTLALPNPDQASSSAEALTFTWDKLNQNLPLYGNQFKDFLDTMLASKQAVQTASAQQQTTQEHKPGFSGNIMDRRNFLSFGAAAAVGAAAATVFKAGKNAVAKRNSQAEEESLSYKKAVDQFEMDKRLGRAKTWFASIGTQLEYSPEAVQKYAQEKRLTIGALTLRESAEVAEDCIRTLEKYPKFLLKNLLITQWFLGEPGIEKDLFKGDFVIGGRTSFEPIDSGDGQRVFKVRVYISKTTVVQDIIKNESIRQSFDNKAYKDPVQRWVNNNLFITFAIHHELYHILKKRFQQAEIFEQAWSDLSKKTKAAIPTDKQDGAYEIIDDYGGKGRLPGSVRNYGIEADKDGTWEDDQAEVFALMRTDPEFALKLAQEDQILRAKIELMKQNTSTITNGALDEKFWNDTFRGVDTNEQYWQQREKAA